MPKFKNKITKSVVTENIMYYVNLYRKNSNYVEIIEKKKSKPQLSEEEQEEQEEQEEEKSIK